MLKEEHQKMLSTIKKYAIEKIDQAINTDSPSQSKIILLD
jgi:hypothetical protein